MNLKGSKTEQNLKDAFAGESQANRRYLYFAKVAYDAAGGDEDVAGAAEEEGGYAGYVVACFRDPGLEAARDAGAHEALFVRDDGLVTEGCFNTVFVEHTVLVERDRSRRELGKEIDTHLTNDRSEPADHRRQQCK